LIILLFVKDCSMKSDATGEGKLTGEEQGGLRDGGFVD
jgi:hypothetical protein